MKGAGKSLSVIGRRERVSFPEMNLYDVEAKIDTGAYTTTIHCHDVKVCEINSKRVLSFKLLDPEHTNYCNSEQIFENFKIKTFKNSFGDQEDRYVIKTLIVLGKRRVRSTVSLTSRANMRYPVLIGRKLLKHRFIVNVAEENILTK